MTPGLASLLSLLQLSDSAFPSGRYTLSYGLETLVQSGQLPVPAESLTLIALLGDSVRLAAAPSDGAALACAHRAASADGDVDLEAIALVDARLTAVKLPREAREASSRTGRAVLATASVAIGGTALHDYAELVRAGRTPGNHAVVVGLLHAQLGVPRLAAVAAELYAFSSSWVAAAVRLGLVDHRGAQALLHRSRHLIADAALQVVDRDVNQILSCTPTLDVIAMRHEQAALRLFAT
jgi:urease accessory protein